MPQKNYTPEYRINAVELSKEIGASQAAWELKIPPDTLYTWISRAKNGTLPQVNIQSKPKSQMKPEDRVKELEREVKALQRENAQMKRENEILEESTAFFVSRRKK